MNPSFKICMDYLLEFLKNRMEKGMKMNLIDKHL